jgi:hypothetical protein
MLVCPEVHILAECTLVLCLTDTRSQNNVYCTVPLQLDRGLEQCYGRRNIIFSCPIILIIKTEGELSLGNCSSDLDRGGALL